MVAQAEHIPVHLGAMPEAVAAVMERDPRPGDVLLLNDPYRGGTHLPDITLVSPVDARRRGGRLRRHARAPLRRRRHEPGLDAVGLARASGRRGSSSRRCGSSRGGELDEDVLELLLANVRTPDIRRGDLRAQIAANRRRGAARSPSWSSAAAATWSRPRSTRCSPTPSGARARRSRAAAGRRRTGRAGEIEGDGVSDEDIPIAVAVDDRRRRARGSTSRAPPDAGRGQRQLPAGRHALGVPVRAARAAAARRARQRRAPSRRSTIEAPEGSLVHARGPRRWWRQRRDLAAHRRHRAARARPGASTCPRRGRGR